MESHNQQFVLLMVQKVQCWKGPGQLSHRKHLYFEQRSRLELLSPIPKSQVKCQLLQIPSDKQAADFLRARVLPSRFAKIYRDAKIRLANQAHSEETQQGRTHLAVDGYGGSSV